VAGTPILTGGSHHQQQHNLRHIPLRPPAPAFAHGLAERFSSSSSSKRSTKKPAGKKDTPVDAASGGDPFYVVRKGDVIGIYNNLPDCQAQVSNSVKTQSISSIIDLLLSQLCAFNVSFFEGACNVSKMVILEEETIANVVVVVALLII
jgi:hypothetical protein